MAVDELPDFHDGFTDGFFIRGAETRVFLRTYAGESFTLVLREVDALHVDNFRQGNIVFELTFLEPEALTVSGVRELYQYGDLHMKSFVFDEWIAGAKQKELKTVEISSSYGCTLSAVFKHHEVIRGHVL